MLFNRKELEEQKNDLITRAEQSVNKAKEEKRELTDDEMAELAEIRDNVRKIVEKLKLDDDFNGMEDKKPKPEQRQQLPALRAARHLPRICQRNDRSLALRALRAPHRPGVSHLLRSRPHPGLHHLHARPPLLRVAAHRHGR